jgi:hypothetical protein
MAHVHTFGQVAPAAAGIIQCVPPRDCVLVRCVDGGQSGCDIVLRHRVRLCFPPIAHHIIDSHDRLAATRTSYSSAKRSRSSCARWRCSSRA